MGDVAIAPQDANLVWVGTGENNNRQSSSWGEGVFKSTDGEEFDKELAKLKPQLGVGQTGFDPGAFQRNVRQRIAGLKGSVLGSTSRPTEVQLRQVAEGRAALAALVVEVNAAIGKAQGLYRDLAAANLLMEVPKPLAAPTASPSGGR